MKKDIKIEGVGLVTYVETAGLGKKKLFLDGKEMEKVDKRSFSLNNVHIDIQGNYVRGMSLIVNGKVYEVTEKLKWYEVVLAICCFSFALSWANIETAVLLFPIVGGAIGGGINGVFLVFQYVAMKKTQKPLYKVLIALAVFVVNLIVLHIIALLILLVFA